MQNPTSDRIAALEKRWETRSGFGHLSGLSGGGMMVAFWHHDASASELVVEFTGKTPGKLAERFRQIRNRSGDGSTLPVKVIFSLVNGKLTSKSRGFGFGHGSAETHGRYKPCASGIVMIDDHEILSDGSPKTFVNTPVTCHR